MPEPFSRIEASSDAERAFIAAVKSRDGGRVRELLAGDAALRDSIDTCWFEFGKTAVIFAQHDRATLEALIEFGADLNKRSEWDAGGFGVLDGASDEIAAFLIENGARVDIHAAAWLRDLATVRRLLEENPKLVHARGGDGQLPLHTARTAAVIDFLLDRGADLEARDLDHGATAAQYAFQDDMPKFQHLVAHGAVVDIYMAAALGDRTLVDEILAREPDALDSRVGACPHTKMPGGGGHIYTWRLKGADTPFEAARTFGHQALFDELLDRAPPRAQLHAACWYGDETRVHALRASHPDLLPDARMLPRAAWERHATTVRILLDLGIDPHTRGPHESTPLDRAAFHGFHEIVAVLLERDPNPPLHERNEFGGTPLGTCLWAAVHGWRTDGDHKRTAELLLEAGARYTNPNHERPELAALLARYPDNRDTA